MHMKPNSHLYGLFKTLVGIEFFEAQIWRKHSFGKLLNGCDKHYFGFCNVKVNPKWLPMTMQL